LNEPVDLLKDCYAIVEELKVEEIKTTEDRLQKIEDRGQ
jgi:hypothetical protein